MTQLSPHFTLAELEHSDTAKAAGIDNRAQPATIRNLQRLAGVLEQVRQITGNKGVVISSGFRCLDLNAKVGGAADSAHVYGLAADFTVPAFGAPGAVYSKLIPHLAELAIDQLIHERSRSAEWVHLGLSYDAPRLQHWYMEPR